MGVSARKVWRTVTGAALVLLAACGRIGFDETRADALGDTHDGQLVCQPWQTPRLIVELATSAQDWASAISPDGTTLVFGSDRGSSFELYVSTWQGTSWSMPSVIPALGGPSLDTEPAWSPDGTQLYFFSDRAQNRLYVSSAVAGFGPPMLVRGLENVDASGPAIAPDQLEMFYTIPATPRRLARAVRTSVADSWTPAGPVDELSSGMGDGYPTLSADGLTIYFASFRLTSAGSIFVATRSALGAPFSGPQRVTELEVPANGTSDPDLSADGKTMLMSSDRAGGAGGYDLYVSTRTCD